MKTIDKNVLNMMNHVSPEERKNLMNFLQMNRVDPNTNLIMAIFRDSIIFRDMTQALIMKYSMRISELESRIERLENSDGEDDG